jgi:phage shock protein C
MAKRLSRSVNQKMIAGICGGLADYFDVDVSIVRLLMVGLALVTALLPMVLFYLIAWIVVPQERPNSQP